MTSIEFDTLVEDRSGSALDVPPTTRGVWESVRRGLNVLVAIVGLVIATPLLAVLAVLVKLSSRGPVIYAQTRVGMDRRSLSQTPSWGRRQGVERRQRSQSTGGRRGGLDRRRSQGSSGCRRRSDWGGTPFTIFKFRTMRVSEGEAQIWASPDDPRVTRVGRFLRKYRLDELPQLFNVLRGDMNIVGPRPEQLGLFADLRDRIDGYQHRQRVLPGITGWAQINQHYDTCLDDVRRKLAFDLAYVRRKSPIQDLRIMLRTLPVVMFRRGAW